MKKTLTVTLEVDLEELPDQARADCANLAECEPDELPSLTDIPDWQMADLVQGAVQNYEDLFSGSDMYAKIVAVRVAKHGWNKKRK